ncbi:hypothetical protein ACHHYP_20076 [Achlya hypogyna]|uniref:FYVE-type domain-containing protein n=1 Tax=Achlya hypogyna TaxID=1202772 RepID=A0A1V9ZT06_ACHHY|nr:hypothetical protein ACHHYP_20076 [Achlya hypogyna]
MYGTAASGQHQLLSGTSMLAKKLHLMKTDEALSAFDRRRGTKVGPDEADALRTLGDQTARGLLRQDADATEKGLYAKLTDHDKLSLSEVATESYYAVKGVLTVHTCLSEVMQMLNTKHPEQWSDVMTRFLGPMHTSSCLWYRDRSVRSDDYATSVHTLVVNPAALNTVSERSAGERDLREFCFLRYSDYYDVTPASIERTLPEDNIRATLRGVSVWESVALQDGPKDATAAFHMSGFIVEPTHVTNTVKVSLIMSTTSGSRSHSSTKRSSSQSYRIGTTAECFFLQRLVRSTMNHFCSALMDQRIPSDRLLAKELWSDGSMCCLCLKNFSLFRHKHHCRLCGDAICAQCSINRHRPSDRQDIRVCGACVDGNPANMIRASSKLYSQENIRAMQQLQSSRGSTSRRPQPEFRSVRGHSASSVGPRPIETKDEPPVDPLHFASQRTFVLEPKEPESEGLCQTEPRTKPDFRKAKSESRLKVDHVKSDAFAFLKKAEPSPPRRHDRPYPRASFAPRGRSAREPADSTAADAPKSVPRHASEHPSHPVQQPAYPPQPAPHPVQQTFQPVQPTSRQWNDPRPVAPSWADPITPLDSDYITESSPLLYSLSFRNGNEWPDAPETAFEELRLRKAHELDLLRRRDEVQRYVQLACKAVACPVGAICVVGGSAGLLIAKIGVHADTMPRHIMLESHAITSKAPLVVLDCRDDLRFMANPLVSHGDVGIRFYVGIPLCTSDGCVIGVLSLVDTVPRTRVRKSDLQAAMQVAATVMRRFEDMASPRQPSYHHYHSSRRPPSPDLDLD